MKEKFKLTHFLVLLFIILTGCSSNTDKHLTRRFTKSLERFAETVLENGRDQYGKVNSPLFVDGLHVTSLEPAKWQFLNDQTWILCNFSSQQALMRFLDGMTTLTGEDKYRIAAEHAADYILKHVTAGNGLIYWGGHTAWDLQEDRPIGDFRVNGTGEFKARTHELKSQQPYYELMWRVNPEATRRLLMAIWGGHIINWELLDFNRHAAYQSEAEPKWSDIFDEEKEIPFSHSGNELSFANASLSIINAGSALAALDANADALKWTERLVYRWQQGKHPETGLSGGQVSYRENGDRAVIAFAHVHPQINEANMIATYHRSSRYHTMPLVQMQNGLILGDRDEPFAGNGKRFIDWALEDLKIYGEHAYDPEEKVFQSLLTDGTKLRWKEVRGGGTNYYLVNTGLGPFIPNGEIFWAYAMAYRLSKDPFHWNMTREIATALNLGDIGEIGGKGLSMGTDGLLKRTVEAHLNTSDDWRTVIFKIYALIDLYEATQNKAFLQAASQIGIALVERQAENGLFPRTEREYARTGDEVPLAILHLTAALSGKRHELPKPAIDACYFHIRYVGELEKKQQRVAEAGDLRTMDHLVFYGQ